MTPIEKFKERWMKIMCLCEADTAPHDILASAIDELYGCLPKDDENSIRYQIQTYQIFRANLKKLTEGESPEETIDDITGLTYSEMEEAAKPEPKEGE